MTQTTRTATRLTSLSLFALLTALTILPGCATAAEEATEADDYNYNSAEIYDPIEPVNRGIYAVNDVADRYLLGPTANAYHDVVPSPFQTVIRNFVRNLEMPVIAINKLLQGNVDGFGTAVGRFFVNTIAGVGGIADIASYSGLEYEPTDFGVTMASWGADSPGMYLVLPLLGPSSLRDATGKGVDWFMDPVRYVAKTHDDDDWLMGASFARYLDTRASLDAAIRDTRKNSLDDYAAFRSLYAQHRAAEIKRQLGENE